MESCARVIGSPPATLIATSEVIDMEAYALAKVCLAGADLVRLRQYITDGADHAAADDWQRNLPRQPRIPAASINN